MAYIKFENKNGGGSGAPQPLLISAANATAVVYGGTVALSGGVATVPNGTYEEIQILNDQSGKTVKLYFTDLTDLDTAADLQTFIGYVIGLINTASLKGPDSSMIDSEYISPSYFITPSGGSSTLTAITLDGLIVA
tara:strand:- start:760 stop:1167 length:408 start_codon:yes stop_codon:yes gene_type:complete